MSRFTVYKQSKLSEFAKAVQNDYETPENPIVYEGYTDYAETVLLFLNAKGGGFGCVDNRPDDYVRWSHIMGLPKKELNDAVTAQLETNNLPPGEKCRCDGPQEQGKHRFGCAQHWKNTPIEKIESFVKVEYLYERMKLNHPGVDEYTFEDGEHDSTKRSITIKGELSFI